MSIEQIEYLKAQVRMYREKWETVQPLIDCRVCDHYLQEYMPCHLTAECVDGRGWTRTKVVKIYERQLWDTVTKEYASEKDADIALNEYLEVHNNE